VRSAGGQVRRLGLGQVAVGPQLLGWSVVIVAVDLHGGPLEYAEFGQLGADQVPGRFQADGGHGVGDVLLAAALSASLPAAELVALQQFGEGVFEVVAEAQILDRAQPSTGNLTTS
jgi:hypothetical protein